MLKVERHSPVDLAAQIYGCEVEDLLSYHEFEDGSVAIIAPTGQKFTYPAEQLLQELIKQADIGTAQAVSKVELVTSTSPLDDSGDIGATNVTGNKNDSAEKLVTGDKERRKAASPEADQVIKTAGMGPPAEGQPAGEVSGADEVGDPDPVTGIAAPERERPKQSLGVTNLSTEVRTSPSVEPRTRGKRKSAKRTNTESAE